VCFFSSGDTHTRDQRERERRERHTWGDCKSPNETKAKREERDRKVKDMNPAIDCYICINNKNNTSHKCPLLYNTFGGHAYRCVAGELLPTSSTKETAATTTTTSSSSSSSSSVAKEVEKPVKKVKLVSYVILRIYAKRGRYILLSSSRCSLW